MAGSWNANCMGRCEAGVYCRSPVALKLAPTRNISREQQGSACEDVAGLRLSGLTAPMVLDGPINGVWFQAYVEQVLVPTLSKRGVGRSPPLCELQHIMGEANEAPCMDAPIRASSFRAAGSCDRVRSCIRPQMRLLRTAGRYGDARTKRRSLTRAVNSWGFIAFPGPDLTDHLSLPFVDLLTRPTFP